jgi:hypothetical protein
MHLVYIDGSNEGIHYTFSAVAVAEDLWLEAFKSIKEWRRELRNSDGVFVYKELHACELVAGRGKISAQVLGKWRRNQIFRAGLSRLAVLPGTNVFNAYLQSNEDWAFERLLNRINRTMQTWNSRALLICDEGNEAHYTKLVRRMSVHNPIPSQYGIWQDTGRATKNIPLDSIIEDPFFKNSACSYFVQLADFCAYALLRRERPLAARTKYNLHTAFDVLAPVCVKAANPRDVYGIIR